MVVDQDDPGRIEPDGVAEELPDAHERRRHVPLVDGGDAQDVVLRVEHHDPQLLALEATHLEDEPVGDVMWPTDRPARRRPVCEQPPPELERGHQLGGLGRADPVGLRKFQVRGAGEPGQPFMPNERVGREIDGRTPARPGTPDEADQLGRGQPTHAAQGETLARPFLDGHLPDRPSTTPGIVPGLRGQVVGSGHRGTSKD